MRINSLPFASAGRQGRRESLAVSLGLLAAMAVLVGAVGVHGAQAQGSGGKAPNEGIFRDGSGGSHTWRILRSHAMQWDEKPYLPAGVVFHSAYLAQPSAETLAKDAAELDRLRAAGIQDLWIDSSRGLLAGTNEQVQAVIDAVETRGFRYGIRVGERNREPLVGYQPGLSRVPVTSTQLKPGGKPSWKVRAPRGRKALYALVDRGDDGRSSNWAIATGEAIVEQDSALIQVALPARSTLLGKTAAELLVAPEVQVEPESLGSYGDLWGGMDKGLKQVQQRLTALKLGPGFRFVLDPFSAGDGTVGDEDEIFPSSNEFRKAFQEWLTRRKGINALNISWRLTDTRLLSFEEAARMVPLWSRNDPPEGDGWLLDAVDRVAYRCDARQSSIWADLDTFRAETLKRWMNRFSLQLKQEGMNVPILYSWSAYHPLFSNTDGANGYDGLGANLYGVPKTLGKESAAYALAQVEESGRCTWMVASRLAGAVTPDGKPSPIGEGQVKALWQSAREAGFRGVFLDPEQTPNAVTSARELAGVLAADSGALKEVPRVCFFPMALSTADRVTRLSNGVWWVPSSGTARILRYGESILGYEMPRPLGDGSPIPVATVLWSTRGPQEVTFYLPVGEGAVLMDTAGAEVKGKLRKGNLKLTLTEEPILATGVGTGTLFPMEVTEALLDEFDQLIRAAEANGATVKALRSLHDQYRSSLTPNSAPTSYAAIQPHVANLRDQLRTYIWLEGERPASQNFGGISFQPGCSGGLFLKLDRSQAAPSGVYRVRYTVDVKKESNYDLWLAGRVPGRPGVSNLVWQVDEEPAVEVSTATPVGGKLPEGDYAPGMGWYQLGRVTLRPGKHELTLVVPEKAAGEGGRYQFGIDAVVLAREAFRPNGAEKPALEIPKFVPPVKDGKKSKNDKSEDEKSEKSRKSEKSEGAERSGKPESSDKG